MLSHGCSQLPYYYSYSYCCRSPELVPKASSIQDGLTSRFNLRALGRRRPLYVPLRVKQRPVFLLNSRLSHFCAPYLAAGHPFSEVTDVICLVPRPRLSRSPWYSLPVHLCRFAVRISNNLPRSFSWNLNQFKSDFLRNLFHQL